MRKNPEATAATKQNLIDAFCILLKIKPVEKITIREICDKAGYNRSTFYQYFKDVYDILDCVENILLIQVKENFEQRFVPDDFERTFPQAFIKIYADKEKYFDVLFSQNNSSRFFEKFFTEIAPIIMKRFNLPAENIKSKYLAETYLHTTLPILRKWTNDGRPFSVEELSKLLCNVLTLGVLTEFKKLK